MTDVITSSASPEVRQQAEAMGWIPPERYKGDPERFVDAEVFLERGETVLPIVKSQLARTREELTQVREMAARQEAALTEAQRAIQEMQERHTIATQKAVDQAKGQLQAAIAEALNDGNHAAVAELTNQMVQLQVAEQTEAAKKKDAPAPAPAPAPAQLTEEDIQWQAENPWFGTDKRKTRLFLVTAADLREAGNTKTHRAFYDEVMQEMGETPAPAPAPATSKVAGARNSGGPISSGTSFNDLPAEAKAACLKDARNYVGQGKRYQTTEQWQAAYARIYFES